ncbi:MAG: excisionase family DNA-binding protein [Rhizobiales bacterium]|nr:excisionase family DNA-binding protein [Hyphomicrobiales bacterium]
MSDVLERAEVLSKKDTELAKTASRLLSAGSESELHVKLADGQELVLPGAAARLLRRLLTEMSKGNAVTLIPVHAELTTQEAADFLNVSRPHLIAILKKGELRFHMVGTHRRVRFADLIAYQNKFEARRNAAMEELAAQAQELGMGY